jgi:hypothetical protein
MSRELRFQSADDFLAFSKACKRAGRKDLRKELNKGLREAVKPLLPGAAEALAQDMPEGPLTDRALRVRQVVQVTTGKDPGVRVGVPYVKRAQGGEHGGLGASNARLLNLHGQLRHPFFGDRDKWFNTPIPAALGWYGRYYSTHTDGIRAKLDDVLQFVADEIVKEAQRG